MYNVTNDWHLKLCCCSSDQLAARHFLTYIFQHLSAYLLPRDHSHHLLLLHPFTPGRKPIFSTNSSHYRFFISPDCVHELLDHFQIFVLIGLPVWFFLLIFFVWFHAVDVEWTLNISCCMGCGCWLFRSVMPMIGQLMRVHLAIPDGPIEAKIRPKVQPGPAPCPQFFPEAEDPISLHSGLWIIRLPYPFVPVFFK